MNDAPRLALLREVSRSIVECELTHLERVPIDLDWARTQHREYERALQRAGCRTRVLPELMDCPDAVFVEDTAVVVDGFAVLTRPGAESRRAEVDSMATVLEELVSTVALEEPATLDGGDVLRVGRVVYVGETARTNAEGIEQLRTNLGAFGYEVRAVAVHGCLHLKTAVSEIAPGILVVNPEWVDREAFTDVTWVEVDPKEPMAGNALLVGRALIYPVAFPKTAARIRKALIGTGVELVPVNASELAKAEGGVTCCSLIIESA